MPGADSGRAQGPRQGYVREKTPEEDRSSIYASIVRTACAHPDQRTAIVRRFDETAAPAARLLPGVRGACILLDVDGAAGDNLALRETQEQATRVATRHAPARCLLDGVAVAYAETTTGEVARHIER